jgi:hypothetical protein
MKALPVVKSSQVKFKMVVPIDRSGAQISAQPAPLNSPESGHHPDIPIVLFLIKRHRRFRHQYYDSMMESKETAWEVP